MVALPAQDTIPAPTRPPLRYHGAKWRLAAQIIPYLPPHTCYVEPFGGAAGVLLRKTPAAFEVYNDLDGDVVNFFDVLRSQTDALIRAITLTPYSREEVDRAHEPATDPLEQARRFYVRSWQQHHPGRAHMKSGWRRQMRPNRGKSVVEDWADVDHLWSVAARLKHVQIERAEAIEVIASYDTEDTLFLVDPPYLGETRSARWRGKAYVHDMPGEEAHRRLAEALRGIEGMAVVCGYPSRLYDEDLYAGWERVTLGSQDALAQPTTECLWLSAQAGARLETGLQLAIWE
jgi:DNA adenine methylase